MRAKVYMLINPAHLPTTFYCLFLSSCAKKVIASNALDVMMG